MVLKEKCGIKLSVDRFLDGTHVFTVYGKGIEKLKFYGWQNECFAWKYFEKCIKERKMKNVV